MLAGLKRGAATAERAMGLRELDALVKVRPPETDGTPRSPPARASGDGSGRHPIRALHTWPRPVGGCAGGGCRTGADSVSRPPASIAKHAAAPACPLCRRLPGGGWCARLSRACDRCRPLASASQSRRRTASLLRWAGRPRPSRQRRHPAGRHAPLQCAPTAKPSERQLPRRLSRSLAPQEVELLKTRLNDAKMDKARGREYMVGCGPRLRTACLRPAPACASQQASMRTQPLPRQLISRRSHTLRRAHTPRPSAGPPAVRRHAGPRRHLRHHPRPPWPPSTHCPLLPPPTPSMATIHALPSIATAHARRSACCTARCWATTPPSPPSTPSSSPAHRMC